MAAHYNEEIKRVQPDGPYFLCGFSLGGYIVFEMACQLEAQGDQVALAALLDIPAAQLPGFPDAPMLPAMKVQYRFWTLKKNMRYHLRQMSAIPAGDKAAYLLRRSTRRHLEQQPEQQPPGSSDKDAPQIRLSLPERLREVEEESRQLPEHLQRLAAINLAALKIYVPKLYQGKVTFFRATGRTLKSYDPHTYGWSALAAGGVDVIEVPGNHLTLLKEPHVRLLADRLQAYLPSSHNP
jgi:thioesterase domain-containing protein